MRQNIIIVLFLFLGIFVLYERHDWFFQPDTAVQQRDGSDQLRQAFERQISNIQVEGHGTVESLLKDDEKGARHQRFIVQLPGGQTVLVAHNIDLAPRIDTLNIGDEVAFCGEYEWNKKGGVIHWTHHDPQGKHKDGWLRHKDRVYR